MGNSHSSVAFCSFSKQLNREDHHCSLVIQRGGGGIRAKQAETEQDRHYYWIWGRGRNGEREEEKHGREDIPQLIMENVTHSSKQASSQVTTWNLVWEHCIPVSTAALLDSA